MLEVLILAIALSMDAFAVSVGLGSKKAKNTQTLALLSSIYFGLFQALMPLIGYFGEKGFSVGLKVTRIGSHFSFCY